MTDYRALKEIFERAGCRTDTYKLPEFKSASIYKPARRLMVLWTPSEGNMTALTFNRHEELTEVRRHE